MVARKTSKILTPQELSRAAAALLFSRKVEDLALIDLRGISSLTDYYLIGTCKNESQMRAILGVTRRSLSREGAKAIRSEYVPGVRWAVLDFGDLILHLFEKQARAYYSLERLWGDAPIEYLRPEDYVLPDDADVSETDDEL